MQPAGRFATASTLVRSIVRRTSVAATPESLKERTVTGKGSAGSTTWSRVIDSDRVCACALNAAKSSAPRSVSVRMRQAYAAKIPAIPMQILPIFLAAGDEPTRILFDIGVFAAGVFAFVKSFDWLRNRIDQSVDEHFKSAAINAAIAKAVAEEVAAKLAAERPRIVDEAV